MSKSIISMCASIWLLAGVINLATAQAPASPSTTNSGRVVGRIFWQDTDTKSIRWSDVRKGSQWTLTPNEVAQFPKLDEQAAFVQMQEIDGLVLTGVHDDQNGELQSGWIALDSGVTQEEHGDHFHWKYASPPKVAASVLDKAQGNPAHVYQYDGRYYLANDKKNGFTIIDPKSVKSGKAVGQFVSGGGGHITLAALQNKWAFATWMDREGDNMGRVDMVSLVDSQSRFQLKLPTGGLHGATTNSGRVFFAPTDGICWIDASAAANDPSNVQIQHLSLGKDSNDKPLRTGAFANHEQWVLCTTGRGAATELCLIDARAAKPAVVKVALNLPEGTSAMTPQTIRTSKGKHLAFVFQECADGSAKEKLLVFSLDANGDGQTGDLSLTHQIEVGPSRIEGHSGHHEIAFSAGGRYAYLTNPGDGSIWIIDTTDMSVAARQQVGGSPTRIAAVGG